MQNKHFLVFVFSIMVFSVNAIIENKKIVKEQDTEIIVATFDGYDEEDGYAFLVAGEEDEEDEDILYFYNVTPEALKVANLKSDDMISKRFQLTYTIETFDEEDEYGYKEMYEKYTIIKIKKM